MTLSIRDPEADRLARELAQIAGESITEAVGKAVSERLERIRRENNFAERKAEIEAITHRFRQNLTGPILSDDELYDEHGAPRSTA